MLCLELQLLSMAWLIYILETWVNDQKMSDASGYFIDWAMDTSLKSIVSLPAGLYYLNI